MATSLEMATSTYGKMEEFNPELESFATYGERIFLFFEANGIEEAKRVPIFLSIIGTKSYALLRDLLLPDKPRDKDLEVLMEVLKSHFEPAPSVITERFNFYWRDQKTGESVEEFKAELKKLSTHCAFGTHLEEALREICLWITKLSCPKEVTNRENSHFCICS